MVATSFVILSIPICFCFWSTLDLTNDWFSRRMWSLMIVCLQSTECRFSFVHQIIVFGVHFSKRLVQSIQILEFRIFSIILKIGFVNCRCFGSYTRIIGGLAAEAFEFFTSGITEVLDLQSNSNARAIICEALRNGELIAAKIHPDKSKTTSRLPNGLLKNHIYSVLSLETVVGAIFPVNIHTYIYVFTYNFHRTWTIIQQSRWWKYGIHGVNWTNGKVTSVSAHPVGRKCRTHGRLRWIWMLLREISGIK